MFDLSLHCRGTLLGVRFGLGWQTRRSASLRCFCLLMLCIIPLQTHAQDADPTPAPLAASFEVVYPGVTLQRDATDDALALRQGAIAPIGPGDILRTDASGRAIVRYGELLLYLLPETHYRLDAYALNPAQRPSLQASLLEGVVLQRGDASAYAEYVLSGQDVTVQQPATHFALWSGTGERDIVTVAQGELRLSHADQRYTLQAQQGLRAQEPPDIVTLARPLNAARLVAELDTACFGIVETSGDQNLLIRGGAGRGFIVRGAVPPGARLPLLAETESGGWSRTQWLSSFAWIFTRALKREDACRDLPTLPDVTQEPDLRSIQRVQAREVALLEPFFGLPRNDPFFYLPVPSG